MENIPRNRTRKMIKQDDIREFRSTPGFLIRFNLPEPIDKHLVERIKNKIKQKDAKN